MSNSSSRLIPPSYLFSYWIWLWAIVYILVTSIITLGPAFCKRWIRCGTSYAIATIFSINPCLILLIAFITNAGYLIKLALYGMPLTNMLKYVSVLMLLKGIPLWLVWTWDMQLYRDLLPVAILFMIYCMYLWYNQVDIISVYTDVVKSIENNENRTPLEYLIAKYILNEA